MDGRRTGTRIGRLAAITASVAVAVLVGWRVDAQSLDLSSVNAGSDWAAGCGTDTFGISYCAVQKSNGSRALGYVLQQREDGVSRQIRIAVDSVLIDAESPVTIQIDENEPLIWPVGYEIIDNNVISLNGQAIDALLQELGTGDMVSVTVLQKTGEPINFELKLDGFNEAITALEQAGTSG